ncbi:thioesterase II family protein [Streptomyces flavofungini]|uniref:Thioesterase n=1 Tax=Streptomyces flavofungini TaxID=68200 RepID=A0ABS0XIT1_9ACTN|nr:alpha/beta fold hydrolase [Streptomyces flavofungini]MBJ3813133.1 thioesterase [Streptomyces flavofungini]GHC90361.1 oleoyl-ACP hydrolase [Streptomyces flavofungini]
MSRKKWIRTFHAKPDARARLVCFPHAGGPALAFTALSAALPADVELLAVQYPGRQDRRAEPFAEDVTTLAAGVVDALAAFDDRPLFLLGHSFGALVAFESARLLEERAGLARLFASAAWPPSADWRAHAGGVHSDEELLGHVRWLGGVPDALLDDPETVAEMTRLLRGDQEVLGRYQAADGAAVTAPLTVLLARDDPKNTAGQLADWERHTTGEYGLELLPGGHFALTEPGPTVVPLLTRVIREDLRRAAATGTTGQVVGA